MSISALYGELAGALEGQILGLEAMIRNCHRTKEAVRDGGPGSRRPAPRGRDGAAGAALLGKIIGWNPAPQGGQSWGGPNAPGPTTPGAQPPGGSG